MPSWFVLLVFGIILIQFFDGKTIGLGRIWSFVLGFRPLVARLAPFERVGTKKAKKILATESVNSLRISAPQWWPLREGRDGTCEGRNEKWEQRRRKKFWQRKVWTHCEFQRHNGDLSVKGETGIEGRNGKCEFLARESVNSSPIVRILAKGKCKFIATLARQWWRHFRLSLFLSLCISLSLSLSPNVPHGQYRKRFRASYNTRQLVLSSLPFLKDRTGFVTISTKSLQSRLPDNHLTQLHWCRAKTTLNWIDR